MKDMEPKNEHELESFLNELPPFPSDISQAAHYIKNTGMAYSTYLKHIKTDDKDFTDSQKSTLANISEYTKTRNSIVRLSVQKIISSNEEFRELLLLLSLVDLQNIPKDLLVAYKGEIIANNFLQEMRKFSLITENNSNINNKIKKDTFFMHYSTQHIIHNYLAQTVPVGTYKDITLYIEHFMKKL